MAFALVTKDEPKRVYGGENAGWINLEPEEPPPPENKAHTFATKEEANEFAAKHGIKADVVEMADK